MQDWELGLGIVLAIVFFLLWGLIYTAVADYIAPWIRKKLSHKETDNGI